MEVMQFKVIRGHGSLCQLKVCTQLLIIP